MARKVLKKVKRAKPKKVVALGEVVVFRSEDAAPDSPAIVNSVVLDVESDELHVGNLKVLSVGNVYDVADPDEIDPDDEEACGWFKP